MAARKRHQAKAALWSCLLTFVGGNLGFIAYLLLNPGWRDPQFTYPARQLQERLESAPEPHFAVAFLGSSLTGNGIDPRRVEPHVQEATGQTCVAQNLHVLGAGPISQRMHVERLVAMGVRVDALVLELSPAWYAYGSGRPYEYGNPAASRLTWDEITLLAQYGFPDQPYRDDWLEAMLNPFTGYRFELLGRLRSRWLPPGVVAHDPRRATLGHRPSFFANVNEDQRQRGLRGAEQTVAALQNLRFEGTPVQALRDTLRRCREQGIAVGVFVPPLATGLNVKHPPATNERIGALLRELEAEGCVVADLRAALPDDLFQDGQHVVRDGVPAYTQAVTDKVVVPLARRRK